MVRNYELTHSLSDVIYVLVSVLLGNGEEARGHLTDVWRGSGGAETGYPGQSVMICS